MKRTFFVQIATVLFFLVAGFTAQAQTAVGGGLAFSTDLSYIGLNLRAQFDVTELGDNNVAVAPNLTYYFADEGFSWVEINGDVYLQFGDSEGTSFYPIVGLRYDLVTINLGPFGSASTGQLGLNAGAGAQFAISDGIKLYAEAKAATLNGTRFVAGAGVLFNLN